MWLEGQACSGGIGWARHSCWLTLWLVVLNILPGEVASPARGDRSRWLSLRLKLHHPSPSEVADKSGLPSGDCLNQELPTSRAADFIGTMHVAVHSKACAQVMQALLKLHIQRPWCEALQCAEMP